jgi:hypothetical protein
MMNLARFPGKTTGRMIGVTAMPEKCIGEAFSGGKN